VGGLFRILHSFQNNLICIRRIHPGVPPLFFQQRCITSVLYILQCRDAWIGRREEESLCILSLATCPAARGVFKEICPDFGMVASFTMTCDAIDLVAYPIHRESMVPNRKGGAKTHYPQKIGHEKFGGWSQAPAWRLEFWHGRFVHVMVDGKIRQSFVR
jgi:hypothetical protein